jgi:Fur family transcriptional regulator, peroxide stress response regulator
MMKKSKQRAAIIRILSSTSSHPSAEWIFEQVKKEIPDIGLATVYRNLRLLRESGEIIEMHPSHLTAHYDACIRDHYHFFCERCGKVIDLNEPVDISLESRITAKTGLKINHHNLVFSGLCLDCQDISSTENYSEKQL